jgi:hypothetical protein
MGDESMWTRSGREEEENSLENRDRAIYEQDLVYDNELTMMTAVGGYCLHPCQMKVENGVGICLGSNSRTTTLTSS